MSDLININDFLKIEKGEFKSSLMNASIYLSERNTKNFIKKSFGLDEIVEDKVISLSEENRQFLIEEISKSNIEKSLFIIEHSNDKLNKDLKASRGDITKFEYFGIIENMISEVELSSPDNQEILKAKDILLELRKHKDIYVQAFRNDNMYRKMLFYASSLSSIFTVIKEHLMMMDVTESKNKLDIKMIKDGHYIATDLDNLKNLNINLKLLRSRASDTDNVDQLKAIDESFLGAAVQLALGVGTAVSGALIAMPVIKIALLSLGAMAGIYLISRLSSKPIIEYMESYEYVKHIAEKSRLKSDKEIIKNIDKMSSYKKRFLNLWKDEKSKNIQEYMKDLSKDEEVIRRYELKTKSSNDKSQSSSKEDNKKNNISANSFI